jgi:hypothetical protein
MLPKRRSPLPLTRDYLDSSLRVVTRDLMQHMTRSIEASEKRLGTRINSVEVRLGNIEDRMIVLETQMAALMTEEVLRHHLRRLATNLVRELRAQGIRLDPAKLTD